MLIIAMRKDLERDFFWFGVYFKGINELGFVFNNFMK